MPTDPIHAVAEQHTARLVAAVPVPLGPTRADALHLLTWPGHRLLVQHEDERLAVRDLGDLDGPEGAGPEIRFRTPWPRRTGQATVSPTGDIAVFSGVHDVRAVDRAGAVLWQLPHGCWATPDCAWTDAPYSAYADDARHGTPDRGSAAFSADGKLVWAHVRQYTDGRPDEQWLVLDAADGQVLGRAHTMTVGSASEHLPHPDPAYMGLTVGEGHEDSPALWGHWDGTALTVERIEGELLQSVAPSGRYVLGTDPGQWALYLHEATDGSEVRRLNARDAVPPAPEEAMARWDYAGAYPYEDGVVVGTEEHAAAPRHWLVDPRDLSVRGQIAYPSPVTGSPRPAGPGQWYTLTADHGTLHLWTLPDKN
ncbi:hypothetical protein V2W30_07880 [Streptomyces sp. Q6]|uniref:Uncharacterized protein n=1 Tax=Streptomyces citrinus TaxID=3118173 RepID=A0ACD5A7R9_9ACTN